MKIVSLSKTKIRNDQDFYILLNKDIADFIETLTPPQSEKNVLTCPSADIIIEFLEITEQYIDLRMRFVLDEFFANLYNEEDMFEILIDQAAERIVQRLTKYYDPYILIRCDFEFKYCEVVLRRSLTKIDNGLVEALRTIDLIVGGWTNDRLLLNIQEQDIPTITEYTNFTFFKWSYNEIEPLNFLYLITKTNKKFFIDLDYSPIRDLEHSMENLPLLYRACRCLDGIENVINDFITDIENSSIERTTKDFSIEFATAAEITDTEVEDLNFRASIAYTAYNSLALHFIKEHKDVLFSLRGKK